jgi:hypothetical protein
MTSRRQKRKREKEKGKIQVNEGFCEDSWELGLTRSLCDTLMHDKRRLNLSSRKTMSRDVDHIYPRSTIRIP